MSFYPNITCSAGIRCFSLVLTRSGWRILTVLGMNHAFFPVQARESVIVTVKILELWQLPVLVFGVLLPPTAVSAAALYPIHHSDCSQFLFLLSVSLVPTAALVTVIFAVHCYMYLQSMQIEFQLVVYTPLQVAGNIPSQGSRPSTSKIILIHYQC